MENKLVRIVNYNSNDYTHTQLLLVSANIQELITLGLSFLHFSY